MTFLIAGQPVAPGRGTGQAWAREELAKPAYERARPSLLIRFLTWLVHQLEHAAARTGLGAGQLAVLIVVVIAVVVVAVIWGRKRVRLSTAGASASHAVLGAGVLTGAEHRLRAQQAMAEGRYAEAVREWLRAVARRLDERALIEPRPGRTADELAVEAARLLPQLQAELMAGARTFDDVVYGSVAATATHADQLRQLDAQVEAARPVVARAFAGRS